MPHTNDVVIIGGGLAGLAAAHRLSELGAGATILEASDRLGGRTRGEYWEPAGRVIDMGGTWLLPTFENSLRLAKTYDLELVNSPESKRWVTHFREGVTERQLLDPEDQDALLRSSRELAAVIEHRSEGLSAQEALDRVDMSDRIVDWHRATQRFLTGALLDEFDAGHLLLHDEDLIDPEHYRIKFAGSTLELVNALAEHSNADIRLGTPVTRVERITHGADAGSWQVTTETGKTLVAKQVIVAVARNVLGKIEFSPELTGPLAELAAHPHAGNSRKDWFVLDGVPKHFRVFASEGLFSYFRSELRLDDGGLLAVAFAPFSEGRPSVEKMQTEIRRYLPTASVRAHTCTDWGAEPWAKGTWVAPRPGDYARMAEAAASPTDGISFVGGDLSMTFPGTIEGAIETGIAAADRAYS